MGFGVITPTEVGVACTAYALVLGWLYREASLRSVYECFVDSSRATIMIMFIIAVSTVAGWIYIYDGVAQTLAEAMLSVSSNKWVVLLMINMCCGYLAVPGADPVLILTTPIFLPVVKALGVDPIQFRHHREPEHHHRHHYPADGHRAR